MKQEETSINKAAPPPVPKAKALPLNQLGSPTKEVRIAQDDEIGCISGEEEDREIAHPWPVDLSEPDQATGAHNLTEHAIAELTGELERNSYVEQQGNPQAFKIICDPAKLGRILQEMANEPTQATLCGAGKPNDAYYAEGARYVDIYFLASRRPLPNKRCQTLGNV